MLSTDKWRLVALVELVEIAGLIWRAQKIELYNQIYGIGLVDMNKTEYNDISL